MSHLLEVKNLDVKFDTDEGRITAVENISLSVDQGEVLGIVGESGSGKSVTAKSIMKLNPGNTSYNEDAEIILDNENVLQFTSKQDLKKIRGGKVSMIFQEPMASFAPAIKIGAQMVEQLLIHKNINKEEAKSISINMLKRVGIADAEKRFNQYAFELSGGMRQRAMIAMALSTMPKLLLADEPTTALDVTVEAGIINLVKNLSKEIGTSMLFVSHNLGLILETCNQITVMYSGEAVETGEINEVFRNMRHPYTQGLLRSIPLPGKNKYEAPLQAISGQLPLPHERPQGCNFGPRCPYFEKELCSLNEVQMQVINLIKDIIKEYQMGVIFITHDLGVIAQVADHVAVMYLGSVVEKGPVNEILKNPKHPYTKGLLQALPDINNLDAPLSPIPGNIPSPLDRPTGCVFRTRCPHHNPEGKDGKIEMKLIEVESGHWVDQCGIKCGQNG